jgi:periplasmic protein TonB
MNNFAIAEELDRAVDTWIQGHATTLPPEKPEVQELLEIARELRLVSSREFKVRLKFDLLQRAHPEMVTVSGSLAAADEIKRTRKSESNAILHFLEGQLAAYPMRARSFAMSFATQAAAVLVVLGLNVWMSRHIAETKQEVVTALISPDSYVLPPARIESCGGGGGGGDRDKSNASKGVLPALSSQQSVPPMVVVRNQAPKLTVEPTVVAPPNLAFPHSGRLGDPLSAALIPSNGSGSGGGIGSGTGSGIGTGNGPGVGPGNGGGIFHVGGGVSAPRAIYDPEPQYSDEARKAKSQGTAVLALIVDADGRPREIRIARSLGMGLDEQAIAAVQKWRFAPAMKDGHPVAVMINVEVDFRLY